MNSLARAAYARRVATGATVALFVLILIGCMAPIFIRETGKKSDDEVFCQKGELQLKPGEELDVYYPVPYASTPNLELRDQFAGMRIVDQKPDHFRVSCTHGTLGPLALEWKARGVKGQPAVAATLDTTLAPVPTAKSPSESSASSSQVDSHVKTAADEK
jgi:hypothetical protein